MKVTTGGEATNWEVTSSKQGEVIRVIKRWRGQMIDQSKRGIDLGGAETEEKDGRNKFVKRCRTASVREHF